MKKTLDDLKLEILIYLKQTSCEEPLELLELYEKEILKSKKVKYKHIGCIAIPLDIYNACKAIVPKEKLQAYEKRIQHLINISNPEYINKVRNNIVNQFISLYEEYSNVTTEEGKSFYN